MANAVKVTFCNYADWNQQTEKVFETGNTASGKWREIKCPKGQMVSRVAVRLGTQEDVYVGWNGAAMECQNINLSEKTVVADNYGHWLSEMSKNKQTNFVSALQVKY